MSNLGIAVLNAETDSQIAPLGEYFQKLGKQVFAVFDSQTVSNTTKIASSGIISFESPEKGFENLILKQTSEAALRRFANAIVEAGEWSDHLTDCEPKTTDRIDDIKKSLGKYFKHNKGSGATAEFIDQCQTCDEIPIFIRNTLRAIKEEVYPIAEDKEIDCLVEPEGEK